jgi:tetratricopeptide (TPR) repeat protein
MLWVGGAALGADDLTREIVLTPHVGAEREDQEIVRWQSRASDKPERLAFERLAWAYVAKARRSLDAGYYGLAEKTAAVIEREFGATPETRLIRGHIDHNLHRFASAEALARQLTAERGAPVDFALLSDALIERGCVDEGIAALQRLLELKPGAEAFSRVAHVRWLKGDVDGAVSALRSALQATDRQDAETRAWLLARLSALHLQRGEARLALESADAADRTLSAYPPALLARGRALLALVRVADAVLALREAEQLQPLPEYQWWLADALRLARHDAEADAVEQRLVARGEQNDPRTLALFLATRGRDVVRALRLCERELKEREDVHTHDAWAWAAAAAGKLDEASAATQRALAAGTNDPRFALHAAEIAVRRGDFGSAQAHHVRADAGAAGLTPSERERLALIPRAAAVAAEIVSP